MELPSRTPQAPCWWPSSECWGRVHQSANDVEAACRKLMSLKQRNSDPSDTGSESSTASHVATVGPAGTQHTGSSIEHSRAGAQRTLDGLLPRRTWEEAWDALGKGTACSLKKERPVREWRGPSARSSGSMAHVLRQPGCLLENRARLHRTCSSNHPNFIYEF